MSYTIRQNPAGPDNFTPGRLGNVVDKIVVHHAATTDFDGIGATFRNAARGTSAHYGVGRNNNVDQYVPEDSIAWHAGVWPVNCKSIGIENVNSTGAPDWHIAPETFNTLVELVRDVAARHGLLPLRRGVNLFGHHDFKATACPYELYGRLDELAAAVNSGLPSGGTVTPPAPAVVDQILEVGSSIVFNQTYRVDDLQLIGGIWQVRTNALCPNGFTWNENGIPVMPLVEVAGGAGNPNDQTLQVGARYKLPGTYRVLNIGPYLDRWMAEISAQGWKFWVDVETVTEV